MNSEAQRARNKRKRDKLREKKRQARAGNPILRFRLDAEVAPFPVRCGLLKGDDAVEFSRESYLDVKYSEGYQDFSTEWVYMSTHDVSSSALDAIDCFFNTVYEGPACRVCKIILTMQLNGVERRKVWQGHTIIDAKGVVRQVCSFVKQQSREESQQILSTLSQ